VRWLRAETARPLEVADDVFCSGIGASFLLQFGVSGVPTNWKSAGKWLIWKEKKNRKLLSLINGEPECWLEG
jgi:hypothetical protein